jgi:hypothetical protein
MDFANFAEWNLQVVDLSQWSTAIFFGGNLDSRRVRAPDIFPVG